MGRFYAPREQPHLAPTPSNPYPATTMNHRPPARLLPGLLALAMALATVTHARDDVGPPGVDALVVAAEVTEHRLGKRKRADIGEAHVAGVLDDDPRLRGGQVGVDEVDLDVHRRAGVSGAAKHQGWHLHFGQAVTKR